MHKDLAKKGLAVITLTVDDPDEKDDVKAAKDFLTEQKATFQNYLLVDPLRLKEKGDEKLEHSGPPVVHVFGRDGKLAGKFTRKKELEKLDEFIKVLLEKK